MKKLSLILILGLLSLSIQAQYAPPAGQVGSSAVHMDSMIISSWASQCTVILGWQNIANQSLGKVSSGTNNSAIGKPDNDVVSLGDGGIAIVQFAQPIRNGGGPDFVVFENSFNDLFLELAFVEVSSDGQNYFRFPAHSLTQADSQITTFGNLDATKINNLAGKYRATYGTPFDLEELKNRPGLDINQITHIKIIDVVGSIDDQYASVDTAGNKINDPFPTPFPVGGFDLDGVGAINLAVGFAESHQTEYSFSIYPNPAKDFINVKTKSNGVIKIFDIHGRLLSIWEHNNSITTIRLEEFSNGLYLIQFQMGPHISTKTLIVE